MTDRGLVANARQRMNGIDLLRALKPRSADLVFFDPQYRKILDKMAFGNEGERQKGRANLPQMTDRQISNFLAEIERALRPSGHLCLWMDKFSTASAHWHTWRPEITSLALVDMIVWDKLRFGMGKRTRGRFEVAMILQKGPRKAGWPDRGMADIWPEKADRKRHAHAKPIGLITEMIKQTTIRGGLVVDPCAGGYAVLEACEKTRRTFMGCDLI